MYNLSEIKQACHKYDYAVRTMQFLEKDDEFINDVADNLRKCINLILKAFLEFQGVSVLKTHSILDLIVIAQNSDSIVITDWISQHSYELYTWEKEIPYNLDFNIRLEQVQEALLEVKHFLIVNGLSSILEDKLQKK